MLAFDPTARPGLDAVQSRLLAVAVSVSGASAADLRRQVIESTYASDNELLVPPDLADPQQDPEGGASGYPEDPPIPEPTTTPTGPAPMAKPGADVTWLVNKVRRQYARRSKL